MNRLPSSITRCFATWALLMIGLSLVGCSDPTDPCTNVDCSGHGICFTNGSGAFCACFPGFAPNGHECRDDVPCLSEHCSLHGECVEVDGFATGCRCDEGFVRSPDGYFCFLSSAPSTDGDADSDTDEDQDEDRQCLENVDCPARSMSRCDLLARQCTPCEEEDDCIHIEGPNLCVEGGSRYCAECTPGDISACDPQESLCDPSTNRCVQCLSSDDCTDPAAQFCDATSNLCVACSLDADCDHLPDRPACVEGNCVACSEDAHCDHLPDRPVCVENNCYACTSEQFEACPSESPHCFEGDHSCVACLENDHCENITASRCDEATHTCRSCSEDSHCEHLSVTEHCDDSICVQCTSYAHCDISGGLVCNYTTKLCVNACWSCSVDNECTAALGEGFRCESDWTGLFHCFQEPPTSGCERPWVERVLTSEPPNVCAPPETTTCQGIVEFGQVSCPPTDRCGEDAVPGDGECVEDYCSYRCVQGVTPHEEWCPPGSTCDTEDSGNCLRE